MLIADDEQNSCSASDFSPDSDAYYSNFEDSNNSADMFFSEDGEKVNIRFKQKLANMAVIYLCRFIIWCE